MKVLRKAEQAAVFSVGGGRFVLLVNRGEEGGVAALALRGCVIDGQVMVGSWREVKRPRDGCFEVVKVNESCVALKVNESNMHLKASESNMPLRTNESRVPLNISESNMPLRTSELRITLKVRQWGVYSCREKREKWIVYYEMFVHKQVIENTIRKTRSRAKVGRGEALVDRHWRAR